MRKTMKIMAVVVAVAMIASLAITSSANTVNRTETRGDFTIGFFELDNRLEVRINIEVPAGGVWAFSEAAMSIDGITRVRTPSADDDIPGIGGAGVAADDEFIFAGFATADANIPAGSTLLFATVDGIGEITIGGNIMFGLGETTPVPVPLGLTVTNRTVVATTTTTPPPVTADPGQGTTADPGVQTNPPTGVTFAIIPALLAAGAAVLVSRKRK